MGRGRKAQLRHAVRVTVLVLWSHIYDTFTSE